MEKGKEKRVDVLGPVLLIAVGIVLLLNVLGLLEWSVWWRLVQLWPVFLIALGLEILIGRRSIWGSLLVAVVVIGVAAWALWYSQAGGRELAGEPVRYPLEGATEATVVVDPGIRVLRIEALPEAANLLEGTLQLAPDEEVIDDLTREGGMVSLELRTTGESWGPFIGGPSGLEAWDLGLSPGPSLQLETNIPMGEARLDLTGLAVEELRTDMGLGVTQVILPAHDGFRANVNGALGITTIIVPEGLEARIQAGGGLVVRVAPDGYQREGDVYTSAGYGGAEDRVELTVSQAMGLLEIRSSE